MNTLFRFILLFLLSTKFYVVGAATKSIDKIVSSTDTILTLEPTTKVLVKTLFEMELEAVFKQILTPINPLAGFVKLYPKADNKFYSLTSAGVETELGTGAAGGGGGINFIDNFNFEENSDDWVEYNDGAVSVPIDCTGGTGGNTLARNATTPLDGTGDLKFTKAASDKQGTGFSNDFSIGKGYQATMLFSSFKMDSSAIPEGAYKIFIYDRTNAKLVGDTAGYDFKVGATTQVFQWQSSPDSLLYTACIHVVTTDTSSFDLFTDNYNFTEKEVTKGPVVTDTRDFIETPTGTLSTNATYTGSYYRVGEYMHGQIKIAFSGTNTEGAVSINIPDGYVIDTSKLENATNDNSIDDGTYLTDVTGGVHNGVATWSTTTVIKVRTLMDTGIYEKLATVNTSTNVPFTIANNDFYVVKFKAPIVGWNANQQSSEDLGGREIVVEGVGNGTTVITANVTDVDFIQTRDTTSSFNGTQFTVPETGEYLIIGGVSISTSTAITIYTYIDGIIDKLFGYSGTATPSTGFEGVFSFTKGQVISIRFGNSVTLTNIADQHHIHIQKLASPQTMFQTELVAARYTTNSGQSISTSTVVNFEDMDYDTHNAVTIGSSWVFTAPLSGFYKVNTHTYLTNGGGWDAGEAQFSHFRKNGVNYVRANNILQETTHTTFPGSLLGTTTMYLDAGDTIDFILDQTSGGAIALQADGLFNYIEITRIK